MVSDPDSITIVVPARNEEPRLECAVLTALACVRRQFDDYEILIVDDGSTDGTGAVANDLASRFERITVIHNPRPRGLGGVVKQGRERATKTYVMYVDGKGATTSDTLDRILSQRGKADLVIPYPTNQHEKPRLRRVVSRLFTRLVNALFGLNLKYYNHLVLCRTELARSVTVHTNSHAHQAESLVKLLKSGSGYVGVSVEDNFGPEYEQTHAFRLRDVAGVAFCLIRTAWEVYVRED